MSSRRHPLRCGGVSARGERLDLFTVVASVSRRKGDGLDVAALGHSGEGADCDFEHRGCFAGMD